MMIYCRQIKTRLTVVVNGEGHVGSDDVVEADLAVLRRAVGVQGLHAHDPVKQASFRDRSLVAALHKHRGELVDVVDTHVHSGPESGVEWVGREGGGAGGQTGTKSLFNAAGSRNCLQQHSKGG